MKATPRDLQQIAYLHQKLGIPTEYAESRGLVAYSEALELVKFDNDLDPRCLYLAPQAKAACLLMQQAAAKDNIILQVYSGFRSYEYQKTLVESRLKNGEEISSVLSYLAPPGYSEHHTGLAIDITTTNCTAGCEEFEETVAFSWMKANANLYNFIMTYPRNNPWGFVYEPWHWSYQDW